MHGTWNWFFTLGIFPSVSNAICFTTDGNFWWVVPDSDLGQWNQLQASLTTGRDWNAVLWTLTPTIVTTWAQAASTIFPTKGTLGPNPQTPDFAFTK